MTVDVEKVRREQMRWIVMLALNHARPVGTFEEVLLATAQGLYPDATALELRKTLDYLADASDPAMPALIQLDRRPDGRWWSDLTRYGIDVVEYTVPCPRGIARPEKYW